jgi:hypothetical protein
MKNLLLVAVSTAWLFPALCHAQATPEAKPPMPTAVGFSTFTALQADYGERDFARLTPELLYMTYLPFDAPYFLRPAARLSYAWLQQQMPQSVRIEERDLSISGELGLLYESIVIPSATLGLGVTRRAISFVYESPVVSADDKISTTEYLPLIFAQAGLGVPLLKGSFVVEPMVRYTYTYSDARAPWGYGIDFSMAL